MEPTPGTTRGMRQVEERIGRPLYIYLQDAYNDRGLSMTAIGVECGVNRATVCRWMQQLGVRGIRYVGYRGKRSAA